MKKIIIILILATVTFVGFNSGVALATVEDYEGSILLDVERHGEAYYIYQEYKYYLGRPDQAF